MLVLVFGPVLDHQWMEDRPDVICLMLVSLDHVCVRDLSDL